MKEYRVLITGSREWDDEVTLHAALHDCVAHAVHLGMWPVVVHGSARGADLMAAAWAAVHGAGIEAHRADWKTHGRAAGPIRNALMVSLGADVCLAFIKDKSRGAAGTAVLAERAGIPTRRYIA